MKLLNNHKNLLESFLEELEVPYTKMFADKLYNEHAHRYDMYGLNAMCAVYGIKTIGVSIDPNDFTSLTYPCILHTPTDFVIATAYNEATITYLKNGEKNTMQSKIFKELWTGKALVVYGATEAVEPNYEENRRKQMLSYVFSYTIPSILFLAFLLGCFKNINNNDFVTEAAAIISMVGIGICVMLLQKQLHGTSQYGDKVCSLFGHSGCNNVLNGEKTKILGFSWSEIGLGFFIPNAYLLSLFPSATPAIAIINWTAMIYAVWSIYYQWKIAKSWCALCLLTQMAIWLVGLILIYHYIKNPFLVDWYVALLSCMAYSLGIILIHYYAEKVNTSKEYSQTLQWYNSIKANQLVAKTLIEKEEYYPTSIIDSKIIFGNRHANFLITIFSNPHCAPCAKLHEKVELLLENSWDKICIQYIFSSFSGELDDSCRYLISMYDPQDFHSTRQIYSNWYKNENNNSKDVIKHNKDKIHQKEVEKEWRRHSQWRQKTKLFSTPTILLNGYILPKEYNLEDIVELSDIQFEKRNPLQGLNG